MQFTKKEKYDIEDFKEIVALLRDEENGCPWDKAQDFMSIKKNFIEEVYEALEAIDNKDFDLLKEELGDVLLQIVLHSQFAKEEGIFTLDEVIDDIAKKIVTRHPHVFNNEKAEDETLATQKWEKVKNETKGFEKTHQKLKSIPKNFPSLMYAQKLQKRLKADKINFYKDEEKIIDDMIASLEALKRQKNPKKEKLAKLLFDTTNLIRLQDIDAEEALKDFSQDFIKLFKEIEDLTLQNEFKFDTIGTDDLDKELLNYNISL